MAERTHRNPQGPDRAERTEEAETLAEPIGGGPAATAATGEKLKAELDDLLDEIDEVLETNAEEFVKSYVQKGGQ